MKRVLEIWECACAQAKQSYHMVNASIQKQCLASTLIVKGEGGELLERHVLVKQLRS